MARSTSATKPRSAPARLRGLDVERLKALPPEQRAKAESALHAITEIRELNPLAAFDPHPKQHAFLSWQQGLTSKLFLGGNQSGKTTVGLVDDLIQACPEELVPDHLMPFKRHKRGPFFARLMTPDFDHTMDQVMLPKLKALCPRAALYRDSWDRAYDKKHRVLRFKDGGWFQFNTYKQDPADMGGATIHRVHYDEEPPKDHRSESKIRLVALKGDEIYTLTPLEGLSWTHDEFWVPWEQHIDGGAPPPTDENGNPFLIVQVSMDDNPYLTEAGRNFVLAGLSPEEKEARRHGRYVHLHGLIYNFNPAVHVVREHPPPQNSYIYAGLDPGIRYAAAALWLYIAPDGRMVVYDELKAPRHDIKMVADSIHRVNALWGRAPMWYVIDPAAANTSHQTGRSDQDVYRDYGIVTIAGQNDVRAGIGRMQTLLAYEGEPGTPNHRPPQLVISDRCTELVAEIKRYRWKEPPRTGEETREIPIKKDDHLLDALRYAVMARPYAPDEITEDTRTPLERQRDEDVEAAWGAKEGEGAVDPVYAI